MKDNLSMMRSMGKGMSSLSDTQVFSGVDEDVINSASVTFFGEIGGIRDLDRISKTMNYKREIRDQLSRMEYQNSYLMKGREDVGGLTLWFGSHCHCEPHYSFKEKFSKHFPERMKFYTELLKEFEEEFKNEEAIIKEKLRKKEAREKERRKIIREAKEKDKQIKDYADEKLEKAKEIQQGGIMSIKKLIYESREKDPSRSWRSIGDEFKKNHHTTKKWAEDYEKYLEEEKEKPQIQNLNSESLKTTESIE